MKLGGAPTDRRRAARRPRPGASPTACGRRSDPRGHSPRQTAPHRAREVPRSSRTRLIGRRRLHDADAARGRRPRRRAHAARGPAAVVVVEVTEAVELACEVVDTSAHHLDRLEHLAGRLGQAGEVERCAVRTPPASRGRSETGSTPRDADPRNRGVESAWPCPSLPPGCERSWGSARFADRFGPHVRLRRFRGAPARAGNRRNRQRFAGSPVFKGASFRTSPRCEVSPRQPVIVVMLGSAGSGVSSNSVLSESISRFTCTSRRYTVSTTTHSTRNAPPAIGPA